MNEMVERIARVRANQACPPEHMKHRQAWVDDNWDSYDLQAREFIAAMREPTEAMTSIILQQGYGGVDTHEHVADIWRPMIDAALLENADAQV